MARAKVLVVADLQGSGASVKAMEAIASGVPFAATKAALRGLDLTGLAYAPAADAATLAADVAALLRSDAARKARVEVARALYERNFSAAAYSSAMDEALAFALDVGAASPTAHREGQCP